MDKPKKDITKTTKGTLPTKSQENSENLKVTSPKPSDKKLTDKPKGATGISPKKTLATPEVGKKGSIEKVKSPTIKPKVSTPQKLKTTPLSPEKKKIPSPTKKEEPKVEKLKINSPPKTSSPDLKKTKQDVSASTKPSIEIPKNAPVNVKEARREELVPQQQTNVKPNSSDPMSITKNGPDTSKEKPPVELNSKAGSREASKQNGATVKVEDSKQNGAAEKVEDSKQNDSTAKVEDSKPNGTTQKVEGSKQSGATEKVKDLKQKGTTEKVQGSKQSGTTEKVKDLKQKGTAEKVEDLKQNGTPEKVDTSKQNGTPEKVQVVDQNKKESTSKGNNVKDESKVQNGETEPQEANAVEEDGKGQSLETSEQSEDKEEVDEESEDEEMPPIPTEKKPDYSKPIGPVKEPIEYYDVVGSVKEAIQELDSVDSINAAFANCKTDAERFKLLYSNPVIYDAIEVEEGYKKKDLETAAKYRTEGNEMFKSKRHTKALELYSLCIINAPIPKGDESPELALGFANRSAVLYHLSHYLLCVQDIKLALKHRYPEKMQYKLYDRLGRCYYFLRQKDEAIEAFETGMEKLDDAGLHERKHESLENDMIKQLMKTRKIKAAKLTKTVKEFNHCHGTIPKIGLPSDEIPVMTETLVLKYSPERGRGIYTTKDVEAGELLVLEKPFASKNMHSSDLTHCQNCLNRVLTPLPCDQCSGVVFCSEECKVEAMKSFHFAECRVLETIHNIDFGLGHLALRMILKAGLNNILQNNKKYPENFKSDILRIGFNKDGVYDSMDYDTVYSLVKHSEKRSLGDLFKRSVVAVFMVKCLEQTLSSQPLSTKAHLPEKCVIGGHILRHIQMLPCNAHEVSEFAYREYDLPNSQTMEIGSGIYATLSLINHSCDPNVVRHSYGNYCAVRAIRNIPKGTEVYDSYGALYPLMAKKDRQEKLLSQYFFKCSCKACLEKWPLYFQIPNEVPYFYCEKCCGYLSIPEDGKTQRAMCDRCRYVQDMTPKLDVWTRSDEIFSKKLKEIIGGVVTSDALSVLLGHLKTLDQLVIRPFADYNDCQEAIKQCLNLQANCKKIDLYA